MPVIGRSTDGDITIPSPEVSRRHAEIVPLADGSFEIRDLGSTNGTWVNGQRITRAVVRPGDRIRFGGFETALTALVSRIQGTAKTVAVPDGAGQTGPSAGPRFSGRPTRSASQIPGPQPVPVAAPVQRDPVDTYRPPRPSGKAGYGLGAEVAVALAAQKSYVGKAFLCWFLYWLMWLPGFVMNIAYLSEAKRVTQMTGVRPSGMGCLQALFIF